MKKRFVINIKSSKTNKKIEKEELEELIKETVKKEVGKKIKNIEYVDEGVIVHLDGEDIEISIDWNDFVLNIKAS